MGSRAFPHMRDLGGHVAVRVVVPTPPPALYDWSDEITPEVFRWALAAVTGYASKANDIRIREAALVVEARFKRAGADDCNPFGIERPAGVS